MNAAELYSLGEQLIAVASDALPENSALRGLSPAASLVLRDVNRYPGTSAAEIAGRTGVPPAQVSALVAELASADLLEAGTGPAGDRVNVGRAVLLSADSTAPVDKALAAALGRPDPALLAEVTGQLESLFRRLSADDALRAPGGFQPEYFDAAYRGTPAWETGRPQPALAELAAAGAFRGRVLDVGCGTGEHALLAASLGLAALGVDASPAAITMAAAKAAERGLDARFAVHDALALETLGGSFDTVIDSALFHVFGDEQLRRYETGLRHVIPAGGRYFLLCFSDRQPPGFGPRRVSEEEIRTVFGGGWRIDAIDPAVIELRIDPAGAQAWRASLTRL